MKPLVSIITPCYNDGSFLLDCVNSVNSSTYGNIEHIIVNDGSFDKETIKCLRRLEKSKNEQKIYHTANKGVCAARNFGVSKSKGHYILFVDGDDKISPTYIESAVEILENKPDVSVVACNYVFFGRRNKRIVLPDYSLQKLMARNLFTITSMIRKSDFIKVNGFNLNMSSGLEDWDFWLSILENGEKVYYLNDFHFFYRTKNAARSRNNSISYEQLMKLRETVYENHKKLYQEYIYFPTDSFEYEIISNSIEYKIGCILLNPLRKIINFFSL